MNDLTELVQIEVCLFSTKMQCSDRQPGSEYDLFLVEGNDLGQGLKMTARYFKLVTVSAVTRE
jgi:hypothetical protein